MALTYTPYRKHGLKRDMGSPSSGGDSDISLCCLEQAWGSRNYFRGLGMNHLAAAVLEDASRSEEAMGPRKTFVAEEMGAPPGDGGC